MFSIIHLVHNVSGYNGYRVSLTGIVTADTLDDHPGGSFRLYMQNGQGPWSGIQMELEEQMGI